MTLDEAIKHAEEVAEQAEEDAVIYSNCKNHKKNLYEIGLAENAEKKCCKCAEEHRRLAEWLKELKRLREQIKMVNALPSASFENHDEIKSYSKDTISRQAAIETVRKAKDKSEAHRMLVQLPPAQPGWIPVTEKLPEEPFGCTVTVWDTNPLTMNDFENVLPYFVGWDGEQWNDGDGERCPFEVIAWKAVGEPYRLEGGRND